VRVYEKVLTKTKQQYLAFFNSSLCKTLEKFEDEGGTVYFSIPEDGCMKFEVLPKKRAKRLAQDLANEYHAWYVSYCNGIMFLTDKIVNVPEGYKLITPAL
jgi:hypothetical protein